MSSFCNTHIRQEERKENYLIVSLFLSDLSNFYFVFILFVFDFYSTVTVNIIMKKKLKVGIFSFTGDEGCVIYFLEMLNERYKEWFELIDFKHARILKRKSIVKDIDVAFVEGAISSKKEEEKLREVRNNSKRVVAIGSCAISGNPSNQRNFFNMETKQEIDFLLKRFNMNEKVLPISEFVKVDDVVPGCPMIEENFVEVLTKYLKEFNVVK